MKTAPRIIFLALALAMACGGPPPTRMERLYSGLADELPRVDPSILHGRRVLVDPGHGGLFRGTVGQDSLEETEVNLGVSLYLWGLLREAGAEVYLTRSVDRDFLSLADSSLAGDLQARVDLADSLEPDIFISIHHNAQPQRDPQYNRVETYYKAGDPASLDLAFSIHRHLMRNLGINVGEVRQGNYYVLRNVDIPAVLGESSYLTHPPVEAQLQLSKAQRLEAEAYFLGILDYFARGIPRVVATSPEDSLLDHVPVLEYRLTDDGGAGIDPDAIELRINGERVNAPMTGPETLHYQLPWDAPNGPYLAELTVRNVLGNTSPTVRTEFAVSHRPSNAVFNHWPATTTEAGTGMRVRVRLLDARGLPLADGTAVSVTTSAESAPRGVMVSGGVADFPVISPGADKPLRLTVTCEGAEFTASIPAGGSSAPVRRLVSVVDAGDGSVIDTATLSDGSGVTGDGLYLIRTDGDELHAPGYLPIRIDSASVDTVRMQPWFGGVMKGRRFVLDPEGGRPEIAGAGPLGLAASHVNLRVAHYLGGFLRQAGADVIFTRESEEVRTVEDVARMTNRSGADRYIEIRHRALPSDSARAATVYHFPGSRAGRRMGEDLSAVLARRLGTPLRSPQPIVTYPLQQTACPAIVIGFPSIAEVEEELRLDRPHYLREQAYATFVGIARHFGSPDTASVEVRLAGDDISGWLVTVDETWTLLTGEDGAVVFELLPNGNHNISIRKNDRVLHGTAEVTSSPAVVRIPVPRRVE